MDGISESARASIGICSSLGFAGTRPGRPSTAQVGTPESAETVLWPGVAGEPALRWTRDYCRDYQRRGSITVFRGQLSEA